MRFALLALLAVFGLDPRPAFAQDVPPPVVVELFTARGCGFADAGETTFKKILQSHGDAVIGLTCHVTTFENPSAEYPLPQQFCDQRITRYRSAGGYERYETPVLIINGIGNSDGKDEERFRTLFEETFTQHTVAPIALSLKDNAELDITLPALPGDPVRAEIWFFAYKKQAQAVRESFEPETEMPVSIPVTFNNIATTLRQVGPWRGQNMHFGIKGVDSLEADGFAIIAQEENHGRILAAGQIEWRVEDSLPP